MEFAGGCWLIITLYSLIWPALSSVDCWQERLNQARDGARIWGVNVGGWLSPEYYLTNDLFVNGTQNNSQLQTFLGPTQAKIHMENFWSTFITEEDFAWIGYAGISVIRLPVTWYLAFDGQAPAFPPFVSGGINYLDKAMDWAAKYGFGVIIDLHVTCTLYGEDWGSQNNTQVDLQALSIYLNRYSNHSALIGFSVVNEPGWSWGELPYYQQAHQLIRRQCSHCIVVISGLDYPFDLNYSAWGLPPDPYDKIYIDIHFYTVFYPLYLDNVTNVVMSTPNTTWVDIFENMQNLNYGHKILIGEWWGSYPEPKTQPERAAWYRAQLELWSHVSGGSTFWTWVAPWNRQNWWSNGDGGEFNSMLLGGLASISDYNHYTDPCPSLIPGSECRLNIFNNKSLINATASCQICGGRPNLTSTHGSPMLSLGCWSDPSMQLFPVCASALWDTNITLEKCYHQCAGFRYFGVLKGFCHCGDTFNGTYGPSTSCNDPCMGNASEICGNWNEHNVYERLDPDVTCSVAVLSTPATSGASRGSSAVIGCILTITMTLTMTLTMMVLYGA